MNYYKRAITPVIFLLPFAISCFFYFAWLPHFLSERARQGEMTGELAIVILSLFGMLSVMASGMAMLIGLFLIYKYKNNSRTKHVFWQLPIVCGIVFIAGFYCLLGLKGGVIEGLVFGATGLTMAGFYSALILLARILIENIMKRKWLAD